METPYDHITIIGYGNVGRQLALGFANSGLHVDLIVSRSHKEDLSLPDTGFTSSIKDIDPSNLVILCVPDDLISSFVIELKGYVIAYTSGSVSIGSLVDHEQLGVFYPLQTFTTGRNISFESVPFFIESNNRQHANRLMSTARRLSNNVQFADSDYRKKLHLSAVWINNFTNHIIQRAQALAEQNGINVNHFAPLLRETIEKLDHISAYDAQTGPAKRHDDKVIDAHLQMLEENDKDVYRAISESIKKLYSHYE